MLDPLSIVASTVALGTAAEAARKLCIEICQFHQTFKNLEVDAKDFANKIQLYGCIIDNARLAINKYAFKNRRSCALRQMRRDQVIEQLVEQASSIIESLRKCAPEIKEQGSKRGKFMVGFMWRLQQAKINILQATMESNKVSFQVIMSTLILEDSPNNTEEV